MTLSCSIQMFTYQTLRRRIAAKQQCSLAPKHARPASDKDSTHSKEIEGSHPLPCSPALGRRGFVAPLPSRQPLVPPHSDLAYLLLPACPDLDREMIFPLTGSGRASIDLKASKYSFCFFFRTDRNLFLCRARLGSCVNT